MPRRRRSLLQVYRQLLFTGTVAQRSLAWGQLLLNLSLLLVGFWLAISGLGMAVLVLALVPAAFIPFSYSRLRLHRLIEAHLPAWFVALLCCAGLVFDAVMVLQLLGARHTDESGLLFAPGVIWIGAVWFSAHALLLLGYGLMGLTRFVGKPLRRVVRRVPPPAVSVELETAIVLPRRQFLQKAGLLGAALPFGVSLSGVPVSYDFRVEQRDITLPHWPPALDGLRVVHLSDIHVGGMMDRQRLLQVAALTNDCRPDIVLHTGDFLTHRLGNFDAPLYEALGQIQAPHGQWACFGNHDYENPQRFEQRLRDCGVSVLRNRVESLSLRGTNLELAGLDFAFNRIERAGIYAQAVGAWQPREKAPRILLNHDPSGFDELPAGCADLVLSGHTHGGHVGVQLTSSHAITLVGMAGFPDQGLFYANGMTMYVTRCVGFYGYPMRIGIPPEIALLILHAPRTAGA